MAIDVQDRPTTVNGAMPICRFACTVVLPGLAARFRIRADSDDLYLVLPYREGDVHEAILGSLRPGEVFIDAGANIGYYAVLAARLVGSGGRVIAVEPHPGTAAQLRANLALNGCRNAEVLETALWSAGGETLRLAVSGGVYGEARCCGPDDKRPEETHLVPTNTLDEICRPFTRIGTIKLDIEDSEIQALRGAAGALAKTDRLIVECFWHEKEIADLLTKSGFALTRLSFGPHLLARAPGG